MTYRRRHGKEAKGSPLYPGVEGGPRRIVVTVDAEGFRRMSWLARQRRVPLATVFRDAVWAYCLPIAATADSEAELGPREDT